MFAVSLSGTMPSGTLDTVPTVAVFARRSIRGLFAASMGVWSFNWAIGSSAMPSGINTKYFIGVSKSYLKDL